MDARQKQLYERKAEVLAAAGHPIRLAIIEFLAADEQCVCDIAAHVGAERSNVSRHLGVLAQAGIVTQRKDGLKMFYALRTRCILNFSKCVEGVIRSRAKDEAELLKSL